MKQFRISWLFMALAACLTLVSCSKKEEEEIGPDGRFTRDGIIYSLGDKDEVCVWGVTPSAIKNGVVTIPDYITVPKREGKQPVNSINGRAFKNGDFSYVSLPETIFTLYTGAFDQSRLKKIVIPKMVSYMGDINLLGNKNLKTLIFKESYPEHFILHYDWGFDKNTPIKLKVESLDTLYIGRQADINLEVKDRVRHLIISEVEKISGELFSGHPIDTVTIKYNPYGMPRIRYRSSLPWEEYYTKHTLLRIHRRDLPRYKQHEVWGKFQKVEIYE